MTSLTEKIVVVIGGSSGFGYRVAQLAGMEGAHVILAGRNKARLDEAKNTLAAEGHAVEAIQLDAHDLQQQEEFFKRLPPFDHLVSMVGDVMGGGFLEADLAVIRHVIESKFFSNVRIGQLAAGKVRAGGSLIFTSGTGGRAQNACASYVGNLGINALVEALAVELAPKARVNAVSPTWTLTPFWRDVPKDDVAAIRQRFEQSIPLQRIASIDEIANAYLFLMKNGFVTGQHIAVDGGIMLGA